MFKVVQNIWSIPDLRRRILVVFGLVAIYRIGFHIYLPGVNVSVLDQILAQLDSGSGDLMAMIQRASALTGGQLQNATLFSLGIMPYISASIIFSLLVKVFPRLEALQKEGDSGRQQINRYTRYATVVLCLVQGMFVVQFLHGPATSGGQTISEGGAGIMGLQILVLTAGALFLMWLGEKMTEFGIGNGVSIIIMAGIIASMPSGFLQLWQEFDTAAPEAKPFQVLRALVLMLVFFAIVLGVVFITRGQRRIPIQQARTVKGKRVYGGQRHYMPIRVNSAGVLPIIFAQSLIMIPTGIVTFVWGANWFTDLFAYGSFGYSFVYVLMIGFFTYFWTSLMFNPVEIAQNMKDYGSFIPGIRPGKRTAEYLERIINRITLAGATFLAGIAIVPQVISSGLDVGAMMGAFLGGTSILIVVGVALDLVDKIEAQLLVRHYEGFMNPGGSGGSPSS